MSGYDIHTERNRLEHVARWFSTESADFNSRMVYYSALTLQPFFHGPSALELGGADGQMTDILLECFKRLAVVEGSPTYADKLRQRFAAAGERIVVHCALFEEFETDQRFDTIVMAHILEHVDDPVLVMSRAKRWLTEGGRVLMVVPNAQSLHRLAAVKMGLLKRPDEFSQRDLMLGHRRVYTPQWFHTDIRSAGLEIVAAGGIFLKPLSNKQIEDAWTEQMMDGFYELGKEFPEHAGEIYAVAGLP